jgi:hypothetical protein
VIITRTELTREVHKEGEATDLYLSDSPIDSALRPIHSYVLQDVYCPSSRRRLKSGVSLFTVITGTKLTLNINKEGGAANLNFLETPSSVASFQ